MTGVQTCALPIFDQILEIDRPFAFADRAGHIGPHASAEHVAESRLVIPVEATAVCHARGMACSSFVLNHSRFCGASLRTLPIVPEHKRSEEQTSELQSLMRISYALFCLKKTK